MRRLIALVIASFVIGQPGVAKGDEPRTTTVATASDHGNTVTNASVSPPVDEDGWTVWQGKNWYMRFRTEPDETTDEAEGTVSVVPALHRATASEQQPPTVPASATTEEPMEVRPAYAQARRPYVDCTQKYQLLAQRLLYLRGIDVDPASAAMVLTQAEIPYSPLLTRTEVGLENRYVGGSLLISALSWDTPTKQLTYDLARCLEE